MIGKNNHEKCQRGFTKDAQTHKLELLTETLLTSFKSDVSEKPKQFLNTMG